MKRDTTIAAALQELAPNAQWVVREDDYDQIEWHSTDIEQPSREAVEAKMVQLEAEAPMAAVRDIRNWYLKESDGSQGADIRALRGEEWCLAWDTYRQQLRDLTESDIHPYFNELGVLQGVEIPQKPSS